jgi:hypothetical protein
VEVKKENLNKLLTLVKEIQKDPKNKWFKDTLLADIFGIEENTESHSWIAKINMIEKYLSIDGFQVIDYSFIENERVRNQLICDNIEMSRHRLGKRSGKVDFEEFCRFATLQIEEMLNYFFYKKYNGNQQEIVKYFSQKLNKELNVDRLTDISLASKLSVFACEVNLDNWIRINIRKMIDVRNSLSHRMTIGKYDAQELMKMAVDKNLLGFVDYSILPKEDIAIAQEAKNIAFVNEMDFKGVNNSVLTIAGKVEIEVNKNKKINS